MVKKFLSVKFFRVLMFVWGFSLVEGHVNGQPSSLSLIRIMRVIS